MRSQFDGPGVLGAGDGLAEAVFERGAGVVRVAGLVVFEQVLKQLLWLPK